MTQLEIINFLNGFNPSGATLTADQVATLTSQLKSQINQLSVAVPNAASDAITVLYSGTMDGTPGGTYSGDIAAKLADNNPGKILTINQTEVAALLDDKKNKWGQRRFLKNF